MKTILDVPMTPDEVEFLLGILSVKRVTYTELLEGTTSKGDREYYSGRTKTSTGIMKKLQELQKSSNNTGWVKECEGCVIVPLK